MKRLLIIQQDEAYFLFETLQVLEKNQNHLKDFEVTILVNETSLKDVFKNQIPLLSGLITNSEQIKDSRFDISVNLSLNEKSWDLHAEINSNKKLGPYRHENKLNVEDLWSSYLLTIKGKTPFLTFHLQEVYKNILGFKSVNIPKMTKTTVRQIAFGTTALHLFSAKEQEEFIHDLTMNYPQLPLRDISEIDIISDVSHTIYIGPATLEALKFCEAGGKGIFLTSGFQGFNLLPNSGDHKILSSRGGTFKAEILLDFIEKEISGNNNFDTPYSVYSIDSEYIFGAYLKSLNISDDNYPFYQSHVVLWNFLLNLFDTNLEIIKCNDSQLELLKSHHATLKKFIRLHDYAMVSIDIIYNESKAQLADATKINGHINNLQEIEKISDQIAQSHSLLRPVLDFYRIRRGQNQGTTLFDQSQASFMTYSEEHQALQALEELFSVTLRKNEVNI